MKLTYGLSTFIFAFLFCVLCIENANGQTKVLKGATLFDGTGSAPVENGVIVIEDETIRCVGTEQECSIPSNAEVTDVSGKFITPGLVDAHAHFFQTGFFDSRPDALDLRSTYPYEVAMAYQKNHPGRYYDAYACSGVTAVYDVGGFPWSIDLQESAEEIPMAPHVAAAGPLITPIEMDILNTPADKVLVNLENKEIAREAVRYVSKLGSTGIKIWTLRKNSTHSQQEIFDIVQVAAQEAKKQGNSIIAHATSLIEAKAALRSGASLLVHSVQDTAIDKEFISLAKENGTFYNPTLTVGNGYLKAYRAAAGIAPFTINDPNGCVDSKTKDLLNNASQFSDHPRFTDDFKKRMRNVNPAAINPESVLMTNLIKVYEADIPIVVGTDAGNPGTLHGISIHNEMEAMQKAGIPAEDLIVMATRNGAMAMQRGEDFGTLEKGKFGNFIILEQDPSADIANMRSITHTMIKGKLMPVDEIPGSK